MKTEYSTNTSVFDGCNFFYLFNFEAQEEVYLAGFNILKDKYRKNDYCLGVWKIKTKK